MFLRFRSYIAFALGGKTILDKLKAFALQIAMTENGSRKMKSLQRIVEKNVGRVSMRHRNLGNFQIAYNLSDPYQIAISREFLLENAYDLTILPFQPRQIIDCGGFHGYFSLMAAKAFRGAAITCIEPHPANIAMLRTNLSGNSIKNVNILEKALAKSTQSIELFVEGSVSSINAIDHTKQTIKVPTVDLCSLIQPDLPLLLKVDIEGAELEFFPDIIPVLPKKSFVFLETHDEWESLPKIQKVFEENGFVTKTTAVKGRYIDSYAYRF